MNPNFIPDKAAHKATQCSQEKTQQVAYEAVVQLNCELSV
jgi:hypothetical protein